jgi:predicted RNA-binding protein with PIN domain
MVLVVDGFNLIYKFPHLEQMMYENQLEDARKGLVSILQRYNLKRKTVKIHLFLDGRKEKSSPVREDNVEKIHIHYSLDEKADFIIKDFIKKNPSPQNLFVVSSDKDIILYSKRYGCKSYKSEEFASMLNSLFHKEEDVQENDDRIHRTLNPSEMQYWANLFRNREK